MAALLASLMVLHRVGAADFNSCYLKLQNIGADYCENPDFVCPAGGPTSPTRPQLTLQGCYNQCGTGFGLDSAEDSAGRFFLWLVPGLVLIAHMHFPSLGWKNILLVVVSIIGNPIGCISSMLTRQEVFERCLIRTRAAGITAETAEDIAAVGAACEEYGWHDPLSEMLRGIQARFSRLRGVQVPQTSSEANDEEAASGRSWGATPREDDSGLHVRNHEPGENAPEGDGEVHLEDQPHPERPMPGEGPEQLLLPRDESSPPCTAVQPDISRRGEGTVSTDPIEDMEKYFLARARFELTSHRGDSQLSTWAAIVGFVGGLGATIVRTVAMHDGPWTTRTISMAMLNIHIIALVKLSGNIGAFTSACGPLIAIQRLQRSLHRADMQEKRSKGEKLNFSISLDAAEIWARTQEQRRLTSRVHSHSMDIELQQRVEVTEEPLLETTRGSSLRFSHAWISAAPYLGMNSTWRPDIPLTGDKGAKPRSSLWSRVIAVGIVTISYLSALFNSLLAVGYVGFGCQCLIWTLIHLSWLLSFGADAILSSRWLALESYRQLWNIAMIKDSIIAACIVVTMVITHIGMTSTCWCAVGTLFVPNDEKAIILWQLMDSDARRQFLQMGLITLIALLLSGFLIVITQSKTRAMRAIICPNQEQRNSIHIRLQRLERELEEKLRVSATDDLSGR